MTTTFFLVRHAAHDRVGTVLCGRMPDVKLGSVGKGQAERLAQHLARNDVACICTGPLERALETAQPIASGLGQRLHVRDAITEIDFGRWTGMSFDALGQDPLWSSWNRSRSTSRPPEGETMLEAQTRIVGAMEQLRSLHPGRSVILVSHGDVIKAALLYHLGMPIDAYDRIDVEPASISTLVVGDWGSKVLRLNEVAAP
ncbi:histidine phosphatase family protein [Microvirga terrae]|uniref:Histidine phosphatase family protein n=1 Tax=Microvirga terrae TaxID=2740529 RepID=A0ABY5RSM1_9HYPH|nr:MULTISPECIES: histidine phosphatase family protein [Microvirga]MBQ0824822.1 histidine phosphatase family protein [Microvirga sp. HBU67558]UVF20245.1 histidine phosphatase family protein [Microvirga terrae]